MEPTENVREESGDRPGEDPLAALKAIFVAAEDELRRARILHPVWPENIVLATSILSEECGEVVKSANDAHWKVSRSELVNVRYETIQVIAMCLRLLLDTPSLAERENGK